MNAGEGMPELFGMYFDQMLPYAEAWQRQHGGKSGYREMQPFQSMDNVGDYLLFENGKGLLYADWDVQGIFTTMLLPHKATTYQFKAPAARPIIISPSVMTINREL